MANVKICPVTNYPCKTNGCGEKCYKRDTLDKSTITKCKESWSREEMEKAFNAGKELEGYDWHMNEFHGTSCKCTPLKYTNFNEWIEDNL